MDEHRDSHTATIHSCPVHSNNEHQQHEEHGYGELNMVLGGVTRSQFPEQMFEMHHYIV